jgi:hypothetical protein
VTSTPDDEHQRAVPEPPPPEYGAARNDPDAQPTPEAVRAAFEGVEDMIRTVSSAAYTQMQHRAAASEAQRDAVLASDAERDAATRILADAFASGRLTSDELEQRTSRVLAARTHGELDDLLVGLGGYRPVMRRHPVRRVLFGIVAFVTSPFILVGLLALLAGSDGGDRIFGLVLLTVLLPGLFGLFRWAWPRR